jgi:hypothetical protein
MATEICPDLACIKSRWPDLIQGLLGVDGLSDVMKWAVGAGLPVAEMEILAQDEYTHDAIVQWNDRYLVFGVT